MDVEEDRPIALTDRRAVDARQWSARGIDRPGRHVARNDRIRHARQTAVPEMDVRAADLRARCPQQRRSWRKIGARKRPHLDGLSRRGHHGRENIGAHGVYVILERMPIQTSRRQGPCVHAGTAV